MKEANPWYYFIGDLLIKKPKPCMPGNQVHITRWQGCYTVHEVHVNYFVVFKNRKPCNINWDEFVCLKGEGSSDITQMKRYIQNEIDITNAKTELLKRLLKDVKSNHYSKVTASSDAVAPIPQVKKEYFKDDLPF